jgi:hypothetical protein
MSNLTADARASHEANKREMFDGMRAYHQSEIAHKQDAVRMLTTLLAAAGAIFAAIIVPERPIPYAVLLSAVTALVATIFAWVIVGTTNRKIEEEHEIYARFGQEYSRACAVLGLFDPVVVGDQKHPAVKARGAIGQGEGWKHTRNIVRGLGTAIAFLAWLAVVFVYANQAEPSPPAGAVASPSEGTSH